jgi:hypothetical protein
MPLPSPTQLERLREDLGFARSVETYGTYQKVRNGLLGIIGKLGNLSVDTGAQFAVTSLSGVASHSVSLGHLASLGVASVSLFPIGAALGPWIGAARIAWQSDGIFAFHDLNDFAKGKRGAYYTCSCGKCSEGLSYVIDKKEANVAIAAVSIFTAGLPLIVDRFNSVRKSLQPGRAKERYSKTFVNSARKGCDVALVAIMLMCGDWPADKPADPKNYVEAVTCLIADNGWELVKSKW